MYEARIKNNAPLKVGREIGCAMNRRCAAVVIEPVSAIAIMYLSCCSVIFIPSCQLIIP